MTTETTYNGWANYPTWAVNLWLANDEMLYRNTREIVQGIIAGEESSSEHWSLEESHRFDTADALKSWVRDELVPEIEGFPSDLLGWALDHVDWNEIAVSWIEGEQDA